MAALEGGSLYRCYTRGMKVAFYFDPSCPFSWIASRWLLVVQGQVEDLEVDWKPFALAIKNNELQEDPAENSYEMGRRQSLQVLRIMLAAAANHDKSLIELYTAFGMQKHINFESYTEEIIIKTLQELKLPESLLKEANNTEHDAELQASIDEAINAVGEDTGVPTIVFTLEDGTKQGYFGPVLQALPSKEDALKIWQGVSNLAQVKEFYELKRNRPEGSPDTPSTARC